MPDFLQNNEVQVITKLSPREIEREREEGLEGVKKGGKCW